MESIELEHVSNQDWSAEKALKESELKFQSVVAAANDAVVLTDATGRILSMNQATERIFGYNHDLIGMPVSVLAPERYWGQQGEGFFSPPGERDFKSSQSPVEMHGLHKDGTEFPMELSV